MTQPEPVEAQGLSEAAVTAMEVAMAALVLAAISDFLDRARELVMAPWYASGSLPDPSGILALDTYWSARISQLMDDLLRAAGWAPADQSQVRTAVPVWVMVRPRETGSAAGEGRTVDSGALGFADYVLLDQRGRPLGVVEAHRLAIHP